MRLSDFRTNKVAEVEGVEIDVDGEGFKITVARSNNDKAVKYLRKISKPFMRQIRKETLEPKKGRELIARMYSRFILLGWEGLEDDDGTAVPYSQEKAYELMNELPDFLELIQDFAGDRETFALENLEESEGN